MSDAGQLLDRIRMIRVGRPTVAELDELVDLLGSSASAEQLSDRVDPGWSGPSVALTESVAVADAARDALEAAGAGALARLAERYASLPLDARRLARGVLSDAGLEAWASLPAEQRTAALEALARAPTAADARETAACVGRVRWCDRAARARAAGDDAALTAVILEGARSGFRPSDEAVALVPAVRDVAALRRGAVAALVAPEGHTEPSGVRHGLTGVVEALGPLGDEELAQLAVALEHAHGGHHEDQLVTILSNNVERVSPATRQRLIAACASTCASSDNEGIWRWAIKEWGRDALGTELEPLSRAQLASTSGPTVEGALARIAIFAPAMEGLVPVLATLLPSQVGRVALLATRALGAYGPRAAPALDALIEALNEGRYPDHVARALGGMGPAAAPALEALRSAEARWSYKKVLAELFSEAIAKISALPR